jgi:hypothetical protein
MQPVIEAGPRTLPEGIRLLHHGLTNLRVSLDVYEQPLDALCANSNLPRRLSMTALVTRSSLARGSNARTAGS